MKTLNELKPLIIEWANEKNLLKLENSPSQRLKLIEESGELANAILKNKIDEQKDAIGDMFIVQVILAEQTDSFYKLEELTGDYTDKNKNDFNVFLTIQFAFEGDIWTSMMSLMNLANHLGLDLKECANLAWNEIKDRTGKTVNGTFIKN